MVCVPRILVLYRRLSICSRAAMLTPSPSTPYFIRSGAPRLPPKTEAVLRISFGGMLFAVD